MTTLREAAAKALEALELHAKQYPHMQKGYTVDAITALKAALVEDAMQKFTDVNQELEAALAEPEGPCPTCVSLARAVMMDQMGSA